MFKRMVTTQTKIKKATLLFVGVSLFLLGNAPSVQAADLLQRSVRIGTSSPDEVTNHRYGFRITSPLTVGSLEMEYCTNSPFVGDACTPPVGFTLVAATIGSQTGVSGFTIHPNTTANRLVLGRIPAPVAPPVNVVIRVDNITNPSTVHQTVFVRYSTFASNDGTGVRGDSGTTAFSINPRLSTSGFVPPYLTFCVGNTVAPDCTSANGNYLNFGEFSTTEPRAVTSQFAAATNDPTGYTTQLTGTTLTSGNNTIPGQASPGPSTPGVSQFGLNLRANSSPSVGANIIGSGSGFATANYNSPNNYSFANNIIARSNLPTEFNTYTVSYIANVGPDQSPGKYSATMTFVATVSF